MSLRVSTPFLNTNIPGAYPNVNVISQPVGLGATGIIVIFGEATGGPSYQDISLANSVFTPDQLQKVQQTYISGQIVDAFTALAAPSNDKGIVGTANQIFIAKTNNSTKASAVLAADTSSPSAYGALSDQNWGVSGNQYQYQVISTQSEMAPTVTGTTIPSLSALNPGISPAFNIRLDGGALTPVTLPPATYTTGAQVAAALTGLPSGITASGTSSAPYTITLTVSADAYAYSEGWGKSFELVEGAAPGDLASLGLVAGLYVSSAEPSIELNVSRPSTNTNETLDAAATVAMTIGYQGTTATLTIASGMLTTTVAGGSGANLSIELSQYATVGTLATYIASQTGYSATAVPFATSLSPAVLDDVSAIGIASTGAGDQPGRVKNALSNFEIAVRTSTAVSFAATATAGLPDPMPVPAYLSGGTLGGTLAADIVNVIGQLAGVNVNIIVPLFSQDATEDITLGLTDPSSTYTIEAINVGVKNHCIQYSTPSLKRNRICVLSYWDNTELTYENAKAAAQSLGNFRCNMCFQQSTQDNSQGVITVFMPWFTACVAAGMQAGGFYKSITNKLANVVAITDPNGFDNGSPGDVSDALSAGLMILTNNGAGPSWVSDQTTYGYDANFVYNSMQAVYDSDIIALNLAASFQSQFVGQSLADVDAATALSYLAALMDSYKKLKLIASSDDAPLGWKNASVTINGPEMDVSVEIKLATAIYFIPININISQVMQSA
jgi:hypothetical protein